MLNLARLRILRELHRRGTLAAVAEALSYSTSAVSQQIRQLEKEAGARLVEPAGRRLQLTPQGLVLVEHAETILAQVETAEADLAASLDRPRGVVRLTAFQSAALTFVPRAAKLVQERHPGLTVEFHQGEPSQALPALYSGDVDLVVAESYPGVPAPSFPGVGFEVLLDDPMWLVLPDDARIDPDEPAVAQLADAGWVVETTASGARTWVTNACREHGFDPRVVCATDDLVVQLRWVEAGLAVAVLPGLTLESAGVRRLPLKEHRTVLLASRIASRDRPAVAAVRAALQETSRSTSQ